MSQDDFTKYPENVEYITYYDIDKSDVKNNSFAYHNYSYLTKNTSIENLVNMRIYEDVYKNALIDSLIKFVFRLLDLNKYRGRLYNAYIKLQIEQTIKVTLDSIKGTCFKDYKIKNHKLCGKWNPSQHCSVNIRNKVKDFSIRNFHKCENAPQNSSYQNGTNGYQNRVAKPLQNQ